MKNKKLSTNILRYIAIVFNTFFLPCVWVKVTTGTQLLLIVSFNIEFFINPYVVMIISATYNFITALIFGGIMTYKLAPKYKIQTTTISILITIFSLLFWLEYIAVI